VLSLANGGGLVKRSASKRVIPSAHVNTCAMNPGTRLHSASEARRSHELHELAEQLYAVIASGHDDLAFNVDNHRVALTELRANGQRRPVLRKETADGGEPPPWQRARELVDGVERDRRFNAWVLERHLLGHYSVAPAAAGWVQWVALDIDAHPAAGSPEHVARRLARARADRVLAAVWRALNCSAERHPVIERTPRDGYRVWLPVTRGATSSNPEHTWPAAVLRAWIERHLVAAGLELKPGVLEVYPSGRALRAPCGLRVTLLRATRPGDPDALGFEPWPGTQADQQRIDWRGERAELSTPVRRVVPTVRAFLAQWEAQRRTLADWLGRPEAAWDPAWGFLGWRDAESELAIAGEIAAAEKNSGESAEGQDNRSQESDDVPGCLGAVATPIVWGRRGRAGRSDPVGRSASSIPDDFLSPSSPDPDLPPDSVGIAVVRDRGSGEGGRAYVRAEIYASSTSAAAVERDVDLPPDPAGDRLVRGRAFKVKVRRLLRAGVTEPSTRHDAVLTLAFYWFATCGLMLDVTLSLLEAWCRAHVHQGSQLAGRPRAFIATCLREARHYIEHHGPAWKFRGAGSGALATITEADHAVVAAVNPQVATEVMTILMWLAGQAGEDGRIADPVQLATGLLARLCGDRRIDDDGKRRRATTLALAELERIGVLTMASNYRVGRRGRMWSCWYRFGSGELPSTVSVPAATWEQIEPFTAEPLVPTLALVPLVPTLALVPVRPPPAPTPRIEVRVVGERLVREGLVRVLSDGARGLARTLLVRAPDVQLPTAKAAARAPWYERAWLLQPFTPGRLWATDPAMVIAFPDLEARRRMSRRQRLVWGGGGRLVWGGGGRPSASSHAAAPATPASAVAPVIPLVVPQGTGEVSESIAPAAAAAAAPVSASELPPDVGAPAVPEASSPSAAAPAAGSAPSSPAAIQPASLVSRTVAPGRSEGELRAELAEIVGEDAARVAPVSLLEVMCQAWGSATSRPGRRRARGP
jgi:hypothetical protein